MLKHKPFLVYAIGIILISVVVAFGISFIISLTTHIPLSSVGLFSLVSQKKSGTAGQPMYSEGNYANKKSTGIEKVSISNEGYYYNVSGTFVDTAYYKNNILFVQFIIDGDPHKQRVPLMMSMKGGNISVGRVINGSEQWKLTDTDVLKSLIHQNDHAVLRFTFYGVKLSEADAYQKQLLEDLLNGQWTTYGEQIMFVVRQIKILDN